MEKIDFEKSLARLEEIAETLEGGSLSLDSSMLFFEEGVRLAKMCEKRLSEVEERFEILKSSDIDEIDKYIAGSKAELDGNLNSKSVSKEKKSSTDKTDYLEKKEHQKSSNELKKDELKKRSLKKSDQTADEVVDLKKISSDIDMVEEIGDFLF